MNWRSSTAKPTLSRSTPNQRACHSPVATHEIVKNFVDGGLTDRRIVVDGFSRISAVAGLIDSANMRDVSTRRVADPNWDRSQVSKCPIPSQSCQSVWLSFPAITPFTNQKFIEPQNSSARLQMKPEWSAIPPENSSAASMRCGEESLGEGKTEGDRMDIHPVSCLSSLVV
jgi:hypothetical protein